MMKTTTLGYIEHDEKYLMLYRNIDKSDGSLNKWLGVGGKLEKNETADECFIRETFEETGIRLLPSQISLRGIVDFESNSYEDERMYLYTAVSDSDYYDRNCNEGYLKWIDKKDILELNMWEGDYVFLKKLLAGDAYFELKLLYGGNNGDELKEVIEIR